MTPHAVAGAVLGLEIPLDVVVLGVLTGLTYGLLGVGLTLVYRTTRVLNFAHGEMGALAATLVPVLVLRYGWGYWPALVVALAAAAGAGALVELVVVRRLLRAPSLVVMVATIGASQLFFAIGALLPKEGIGSSTFPTPFTASWTVGTLHLDGGRILALFVAPAAAAALALFFARTRLGLASRAAADNGDAAQLAGVAVRRVSLATWTIAGLLAGISAILVGPTQPIVTRVALGPRLLFIGLAAALLGGLTSFARVGLAGIGLGVVDAVVAWNWPTGGVRELILVGLVVASLLGRRGLADLARSGDGTSWSLAGATRELDPGVARHPRVRALRIAAPVVTVAVAAVVAVPMTNANRVVLSGVVLFALMGLSLVVLTGFAGQVSLGQFAFVAVGALVGGRMHQLGYPGWMGLLYAVVGAGAVALVIGLPALRIRGLFLAVTTLGFSVAAQTWLYNQHWLVSVSPDGSSSLEIPRTALLGVDLSSELHYYWLCLAGLAASGWIVHRIGSSGIGRSMRAVRDNEAQAASLGLDPRRVKLTAFVVAGMIAGAAGFLYGGLLVSFPESTTFSAELSLALVALAVLGGVTTVTGAVLGALWVRGLGHVLAPLLPSVLGSDVALLVGGVGLLGAMLQFPEGIAGAFFHLRDLVMRRVAGGVAPGEAHADAIAVGGASTELRAWPSLPVAARAGAAGGHDGVPAIEAQEVRVVYGGHVVLDGVDLRVATGEVVGLVGPNGAGKTTLFDVLSGHLVATSGRVLLDGADVTAERPERRARRGLGRTFQQARLFPDLSVVDAFAVALELGEPSEVVPAALGLPPASRAERAKAVRAHELVELLGLTAVARKPVRELSTGMRRLTEFGCLSALGARTLLLDEPTAGLAQREVEAFQPVLRSLRDHLDATIVLIEHDLPLVTAVSDRMYVLAAGRVLAEGRPTEVRDDPAVIAAYLGTDEQLIRRSGARRSRAPRKKVVRP